MPKNLIIPLGGESNYSHLKKARSEVKVDLIRVTAEEYLELRVLTLRHNHEADAIFSTTGEGQIFPSSRFGGTPKTERIQVEGISWILDSLSSSLRRYREGGGRLFVNIRGAYWKSPKFVDGIRSEKIRFAEWQWRNEPPERCPEWTWKNRESYPELVRLWQTRMRERFGPLWDEAQIH
jgi:hypothetical protein